MVERHSAIARLPWAKYLCVCVFLCIFDTIWLYLVMFIPENKLSGRKALSNSMVAVDEVVPTLKDPRDAHHYEQLAVEDLGRKLFNIEEKVVVVFP